MNKKLMTFSALALSLSLSQAPLVYAEHTTDCFNGEKIHKMVKKLNLTSDQQTKIKAIIDRAHTEMQTKHKELAALRVDVNNAFHTNAMTESKMDGLVSQEQQVMGAMLKIRMMERLDITNVLTDEQKAKLSDHMIKWEEKHMGHHGD